MLAKTHIVSSEAIAIPIFYAIAPTQEIFAQYIPIIVGSIALGAIFPDIDEPNSTIGRKLAPISLIVSAFVRHRTWTHSLVIWAFLFAIVCVLWFVSSIPATVLLFVMGFFAGGFLHILGDAMTHARVSGMFYPFAKKPIWIVPSFMRFVVGSPKEYIYLAFFTIALIGFGAAFVGEEMLFSGTMELF